MNDLVVTEPQQRALTVAEVKGQVRLIQQVMEAVMKGPSKENPNGVHYGVIPGTDKPTLLKAGAEVLMSTFRIAVDPQIEDLSGTDEIRYRVRCIGTHQTSGVVMGAGIGECSSNEEKYKWKKSNNREFDATPEDRRRVKYGYDKTSRKEYEVKQIRTEPADVANTILKMAKKRALVDFTLTALAASDIFAQDLEDMPEEVREAVTEGDTAKRTVQQPKARSAQAEAPAVDPAKKVNEGQVNLLQRKLDGAKVTAEDFCKHFGIAAVPDLPFGKINEALKYLADNTAE
jgi:hypothetical protein